MSPLRQGLGFALRTQLLRRRIACTARESDGTGSSLRHLHTDCSFPQSPASTSPGLAKTVPQDQKFFSSVAASHGKTRALLIANSTLYGGSYMGHCGETIQNFLKKNGASEVLFVPYALKDYEKYFGNPGVIKYDASGQPIDHTGRPKARLQELGITSTSIHHAEDPVAAVKAAKALFIGGGNTFRLLKKLHEQNLVDLIRERVTSGKMLYIGSSCGSTAAGATIHTSICMPIMEIPSFRGLGLVPFNISPHYADPEPKAKLHELGFTVSMEENREQRIRQYTDELEDAVTTVGIREGTCLEVDGSKATLHGKRPCRVFVPRQEPKDYPPGSNLDFLMSSDAR